MVAFRPLRASFVFLMLVTPFLGMAALPVGAAGAEGAIVDDFSATPFDGRWSFTGHWRWLSYRGWMAADPPGASLAVLNGSSFSAGTYRVWLRLVPAVGETTAGAGIIFAMQGFGNLRCAVVSTGSPGAVTILQAGSVGDRPARFSKSVPWPVPGGTWLLLRVKVSPWGRVSVYLNSALPVLVENSIAPVTGMIGLKAFRGRVFFDSFSFTPADPEAYNCLYCHGGNPSQPLAPNIAAYWSGSIYGLQDGGHGDPDGRESGSVSLTPKCTDCHDVYDPPGTHGDGIVQSAESGINRNANTAHLKASYMLTGTPSNEYDIQLKLDEPCWQCHLSYSSTYVILNHRPNASGTPPLSITHRGNSILNVVEFGRGITPADGAIIKWPVDSDLTTKANGGKTYAPCVSCHNPHGTNTIPEAAADGNHMVRDVYYGNYGYFCIECHR